jgi:hypothetical protein
MNSLTLPVVHPAFQKLKYSGRMLHLAAGSLILVHAISHVSQPHSSFLYLGCLLLMAVDIFILVFASNNLLLDYPRVNLFFRGVEVLFFVGIGITMLADKHWILGSGHLVMSMAYIFLFYCEKNVNTEERVAIFHTGVSIPALPESKFFIWTNINHIEAQYDSIVINTSFNKSYHFQLQSNLAFEELDQIHEFCRHYLKTGVSS